MSAALLAWLGTYAVHSTLLLGAAWLATRRVREGRARERLWRAALLGALFTSLLASRMGGLEVGGGAASGRAVGGAGGSPFGLLSVPGAHEPWRAAVAELGRGVATTASSPWGTALVLAWLLVGVALLLRGTWLRRRFLRELGPRRALHDAERAHLAVRGLAAGGPQLSASARLVSPVVLSAREVCLPERALRELEPALLEAMLAHELAHVARRDPWWSVALRVHEALLWFQPLVHVATRSLRAEAELACDRVAVAGGVPALSLARALEVVASWGVRPAPLLRATGGSESTLVRRVRVLCQGEGCSPLARRTAVGALVALTLALACAGPRLEPDAAAPSTPEVAPRASGAATRVDLDAAGVATLGGERFELPAEQARLTAALRARADAPGAPRTEAGGDSALVVRIVAEPTSDCTDVLRVMEACAGARIWDLSVETTQGRRIDVPLPRELGLLDVPVEEEADAGGGAEPLSVLTPGPSPPRRAEVRVELPPGEASMRLRFGGAVTADVEELVAGLRAARGDSLRVIALDVRGALSWQQVLPLLERLEATWPRARVVFVAAPR
ncbi:MAG: M56 family metallopeptidase [Planctomycetes bacterium]|nr:M56 family metallopeptidase [Planctomycetota bacterium]